MTQPRLKLSEFVILDRVDHALLTDKNNGHEYRIDTSDALFLRCIDGNKDIHEIRDELSELLCYEVTYESIFKALDTLSDIGILEQRLAPPASGQVTSRRGFLKAMSATAAATSAAIVPQVSFGQSEQDVKAAEQQTKLSAEQNSKQQAAEQNQKQLAQEQSAKQAQEQQQKNPQSEQDFKASQEQSQKANAEQQQKEESQKVAAQEQQQKSAAETTSKESAVKSSGGGGTASVPEPGMVTLLGLGLGSMALLKRRKSRRAETDAGDQEDE